MVVLTVEKIGGVLVHCELHHMDSESLQESCAELFGKKFGANVLPSTVFHMVKAILVHGMLLLCIVGTAMNISLINANDAEYQSGHTVNYDDTKNYFSTVSDTISMPIRGKTFPPDYLTRKSARSCLPSTNCHMVMLTMVQAMFYYVL